MAVQSFLDELNDVQYKAVTNIDGPVMVIAGPGSGKTRVLTYRIAYMIQQGIAPYNILTLTFTNKAAREMKERLQKVVGPEAAKVWAGTFHSLFAKILRFEADKINFPSSFTIYDTEDSKNMISTILTQMNFDKNVYSPNAIRNRISSAKSMLISSAAYRQDQELVQQDKLNKMPELWKVYEEYQRRCTMSGIMDFDDLLYQTFVLFHRNPDNVLEKYQAKFKYLMVDEFQDTNFLQYAILKKLSKYPGSPENICIVGDDAQSIYAFRGATIDNILDFNKDFSSLKTYKLEQNYRSGQFIVDAANKVITHNKRQIQKKIWTAHPLSNKIGLIRALSDNEEGRKVVDMIFEHKNRYHVSNNEIAILYRTNAQSRVFEEYLRKNNIAYRVYGGMSFYQRKEVKDLLAYFRLITNQKDEEAFKRVVNHPKRGIGDTSIDKLFQYARDNNLTFWDSIDQNVLAGRTQDTLLEFKKMIMSLHKLSSTEPADVIANAVYMKSGLATLLKSDMSIEGKGRIENITSLLDGIKVFVENDEVIDDEPELTQGILLSDYLQNIALVTDADQDSESKDHVNLMSVHSAKGLEFDSVFVTGLEDNLFPSFMSMQSESEIDEERRLFYVAITRARMFLTLSYATSRLMYGKIQYNSTSRFLDEIGEENLKESLHKPLNIVKERQQTASVTGNFGPKKSPAIPLKEIEVNPSPQSAFFDGARVLHPRFGEGVVQYIDGAGDNRVATVRFASFDDSERRIMLKFAKMQVLD